MPINLAVEKSYEDGAECWRGTRILEATEFESYLTGPVRARVHDTKFEDEFSDDLAALATTDMATETLKGVLNAKPAPLDWQIGESLAECLLEDEFGVQWPWNENRDLKTPRASLPGADLVGFLGSNSEAQLLFGEVKTSSDRKSPPGVLSGRSGMIHQIDALANSVSIQGTLLRWLSARCKGTSHWPSFQAATKRYLESKGKDVALVGVLIRDVAPNRDDLRTRGQRFERSKAQPPRVRLDAWYVPTQISEWVALIAAEPT